MLWGLGGAAAWVTLEMTLARILGGFPWNLLGDSQYQMTPLIQIASLTGVYGVSFLMVWFSLGVLCAALTVIHRPAPRSLWMAELVLPLLAVTLAFKFGLRHIRHAPPPARSLSVTLIQPSIPQTFIWDSEKGEERFQQMLRLCEQALTNPTDLVVWPEGAIPEMLRYDEKTAVAVSSMAQRHHVWMIVSSDDFEHRAGAAKRDEGDAYNSCFLIDPEGRLLEKSYRKRNLVIFGEYVPGLRWLPFLKWFTPIQDGFTPGKEAGLFAMEDLGATASMLICFEDLFPQLDWHGSETNVDFLVNLTNDGWFGESAEQWQHATAALFRAVERGVPLLRCANNGITCWIDAQGRFRQIFHDRRGSVYGQGFVTLEIPLPAPGAAPRLTFYTRHGDWLGWTCVGATLLWVLGILRQRRAQYLRRRRLEFC
jgi:apolipoprotein N-acyltransferase